MKSRKITHRGLLIHMSHYDPQWCLVKENEEPFDTDTALEIVAAMSDAGMNLLMIDCADGVRYKSHPELARPYSVPMSDLKRLVRAANDRGIDVAPKLNFSRSGYHQHDNWMRPHSQKRGWFQPTSPYWKVARELIDELVGVCHPGEFFHIGMDEDHLRSLSQYVDAIKILRGLVGRHKLRTIIWNDSCHHSKLCQAQVHADKCRQAEERLPRDIVQVLWDYGHAHPSIVRRIAGEGFEVWGAPGGNLDQVKRWRKTISVNGGGGLLMTRWIKCSEANRGQLLKLVRQLGPVY